jgi:predicted ABC-type ATPase
MVPMFLKQVCEAPQLVPRQHKLVQQQVGAKAETTTSPKTTLEQMSHAELHGLYFTKFGNDCV